MRDEVKICLGQEPKVLLPPCADQVPTHSSALLPHRQRQAIGFADALLHQFLTAAPQHATISTDKSFKNITDQILIEETRRNCAKNSKHSDGDVTVLLGLP